MESSVNSFMPNGISHPHQLDESILKGCWVVSFNFIQILKVHSVSN